MIRSCRVNPASQSCTMFKRAGCGFCTFPTDPSHLWFLYSWEPVELLASSWLPGRSL